MFAFCSVKIVPYNLNAYVRHTGKPLIFRIASNRLYLKRLKGFTHEKLLPAKQECVVSFKALIHEMLDIKRNG